MRIVVYADDGTEAFSYDTNKTVQCLFPGQEEHGDVQRAVLEAYNFLLIATPNKEELK